MVPGEVIRGGISEEARGSGRKPRGLQSPFNPHASCRPVRPMPAGGRQQAEAGRRGPLAGRLEAGADD